VNVRERARLVDALGSAIADGEQSLGQVPALLRRVLQEEAWRDFETKLGEPVHHSRFEKFVTEPPLRGLGASVELVQRLVKDDKDAVRLLRDAKKRQGKRTDLATDFNDNVIDVEQGNSESYALQWLSEHRDDLYQQVKSGEMSAHAAMLTAGQRHRTLTVPIHDMSRLASTLRRHLDGTQLHDLAARLEGE
jgi:hypothetical protein